MNKQTFIQLIKNPEGITPQQMEELEKVVTNFPYCQDAHILIAKSAAENGSMLAGQKLKKAALYTLDRKNLKKILSGQPVSGVDIPSPVMMKELPVQTEETEKLETEKPETKSEEEQPEVIISEEELQQEEKLPVSKQVEQPVTDKEVQPLTDEKRDAIIKELRESLQQLHNLKIKAAWDEVPDPLKVIGINTEDDKEKSVIQNEPGLKDDHEKASSLPEKKIDIHSEFKPEEWINPEPTGYPIRTEDVVTDVQETQVDTDLLLEYLNYLESQRSIFRKNRKKEVEIIDKFIKSEPAIPKLDINNLPENTVDLSSNSTRINKEPVSENFAKILVLQGKTDKAIEIYEQLILKNPEKKPYFVAQIEKLKNRL